MQLSAKHSKVKCNKMKSLKLETIIMCRSYRVEGLSKNKEKAKRNIVQISYLAFPSQDPILKGHTWLKDRVS